MGSKVELLTPMGAGTSREVEGREGAFGAGPDFVDGVEEEEGESAGEKEEVDEIELQRSTREKGFGLGGWVDNLIGWTLFRVDDDERKESDGKVNDKDAEEVRPECKARGKRQGSERVMVAPSDENREVVPPPEDGEGGWQDAAWLLSVASKIIL